MDRIRQAITRARDKSAEASPRAPQTSLQAGSAQHATAAQPDAIQERFEAVQCDVDRFSEHRIIANEQDPVLNAYRVLRTRVLQKLEAENWRTMAVVSPGASAGKTVTAINLAIAISSKADSRTTLVDLDFYRPSVARYLGLKEFPSNLDFFQGKRSLEEVTIRPDIANILLIANERVSRRGAEYLTSAKTDELIDRAINEYGSRAVIFDMSPLLGCDDTLAFLPKVDCVLLVAASGQTRIAELKEARRILSTTNIMGTVLNKSPAALVANPYY